MPSFSPCLPDNPEREGRARGLSRRFDTQFSRAVGSVLVDAKGRRHVDFLSCDGALNYGHNDPDVLRALLTHLQAQGLAAGVELHSVAKQAFIKAFSQHVLAERGMANHRLVFAGASAGDALSAGIRLARQITGRQGVVAFAHSHALSVDGPIGPPEPGDALAGAWRWPYDRALGPQTDTAALLDRWLATPGSGVAAPAVIVLETVQVRAGLRTASAPWVQAVARLAQQHGALLLVDDSVTGGGRCGGFFSFEGMGVVPDLVVPSLSVSGMGLPLGLLLVRQDRDQWLPGEVSSRFGHNHHAFVAGTAALEKFWAADSPHPAAWRRRAALMRSMLGATAALHPGAQAVGRGLLQGLHLADAGLADRVARRCFERGVMLAPSPADAALLRLCPPLTTPTLLLEQGLAVLHRCVAEATGHGRGALQAHQRLVSLLPVAAPPGAAPAAPAAPVAPEAPTAAATTQPQVATAPAGEGQAPGQAARTAPVGTLSGQPPASPAPRPGPSSGSGSGPARTAGRPEAGCPDPRALSLPAH